VIEQGEDTNTKPESSDKDEEEGKVTPPPLSPPHVTRPPFRDITSQWVGITVGICQPKWTRTGIGRWPACLSSATSYRYLLTQGGQTLCMR
jgi:hypothetical protein